MFIKYFIYFLAVFFSLFSIISVLSPRFIVDHIFRGRIWSWYLRVLYGIKERDIIDRRMIVKVRVIGILALPFVVLLMIGMMKGFPDVPH
ncbi:hypothetical protein WJ61_00790 [Burkholderia ubonensis]|nr:hypothetical protein WJ61_00790 [Burkholderia ubonensis]